MYKLSLTRAPLHFISLYLRLDDFYIDMPNRGLRKG